MIARNRNLIERVSLWTGRVKISSVLSKLGTKRCSRIQGRNTGPSGWKIGKIGTRKVFVLSQENSTTALKQR